MSNEKHYAEGGYIPSGSDIKATLHPDECLLKREGDTWRCVRPDHNHRDNDTPDN